MPSDIKSQVLQPLEHILSTYKKIEKGLSSDNVTFECEYKDTFGYKGCNEGDKGWVGTIFGYPVTNIHICVDEFDSSNISKLSSVIIHEASHKFGGTVDEGFIKNAHVYEDTPSVEETNEVFHSLFIYPLSTMPINRDNRLLNDSNKDGIPDYLENTTRTLPSNDLNRNGIPDYLENPNTPF